MLKIRGGGGVAARTAQTVGAFVWGVERVAENAGMGKAPWATFRGGNVAEEGRSAVGCSCAGPARTNGTPVAQRPGRSLLWAGRGVSGLVVGGRRRR